MAHAMVWYKIFHGDIPGHPGSSMQDAELTAPAINNVNKIQILIWRDSKVTMVFKQVTQMQFQGQQIACSLIHEC